MKPTKHLVSFVKRDLGCFDDLHLGFLLVEATTDVQYENQVGGHACHQATVEGFAIPVCAQFLELQQYFIGPKYGGWCNTGIDAADADHIDHFLRDAKIAAIVDRHRLAQGREAWIPICYEQKNGFLTWSNCD